jgi:hypothetical protein
MLATKCAHGSSKTLLLACTIFLEVSRSAHGCVSPHHVQQLQSQQQVRHVTRSPTTKLSTLDKDAPWQPAAWSARVEKNEACFRAPLTLRGGFGVIGMSGGNVKPTTSSGLHPEKSFI